MVSSTNKLFEALEIVVDLVLLNFLFIICSIPLITAYPAFAALVGTIKDVFEEKPIPAWKQFFTLFYEYVKKGVKIWLILLAVSIVIIGDIAAVFYFPHKLQNFLIPFDVLLILLFLGITNNIIKLFILGEDQLKRLFITSFILLIRKPLKPLLVIFSAVLVIVLSIYLKFIPFIVSFSLMGLIVYLTMFNEKDEIRII